MTALEFIQSSPTRLADYQANASRFGNSPDAYLADWSKTMDNTFGVGGWNKPNLTTGVVGPELAPKLQQTNSNPAVVAAPGTGSSPVTTAPSMDFGSLTNQGGQTTAPAATATPVTSTAPVATAAPIQSQAPATTAPVTTGTAPALNFNQLTTQPTNVTPAVAPAATVVHPAGPATSGNPGPTGTGPGPTTAPSGPTPAEQAWIAQNAGLAQQLWGTTSPPAGAVHDYVANWYAQNPNEHPDQIDTAILSPSTAATNAVANNPAAAMPSVNVAGANYNSLEAGNQTGAYQSTGTTNQTQNSQQATNSAETQHQTNAQTNNQASTGQTTSAENTVGTNTQNTTGTSVGTTVGNQATTGTQSGATHVTTPFDIQSLIAAQLPQTAASDSARTGFLTDFMNTGGTALNGQVDKAVRQSLTGSTMTGAGDSARARAAGYAAADVARNNAGQRLQAAQQLAEGSGLGTLTQQTAPLFGTSTSGTTTGNTVSTGVNTASNASSTAGTNSSATTGATNTAQQSAGTSTGDMQSALSKAANTIDFQQLVGNETQAGTASGSSASAGSGIVPQGQPVKTGGCVVCTAYGMAPGAIRRAVRWKLSQGKRYETSVAGYMLYGPVLARAVLRWPTISKLFRPLARSILYHEVKLSAPTRLRWRLVPFITHEVFNRLSWPVGLISRLVGRDHVTCPTVLALLKSRNLEFALQ